jgi:hypothetical protein
VVFRLSPDSEFCRYKHVDISNSAPPYCSSLPSSSCLLTFPTCPLKKLLLLPLPWRLPRGFVRRESTRRWRTGEDGKWRNMFSRRQRHREQWRQRGGRGVEGGSRVEGVVIARQEVARGGGRGRMVAITHYRAFGPKTYYPGTVQHRLYSVWFVNSVKREAKGNGGNSVHISISYSPFSPVSVPF